MKVKELTNKVFKNKIGRIVSLILIAVIAVTTVILFTNQKEQHVDTTYLVATLEKASEMTTAKLNYTGMSEFEDDGVPFISKSDFIMVYKATARAGIDVKEVKITSDDVNHTVYITLPQAKVLDVKVDSGSIKYFDTKFALFNLDEKEDASKAQALAEKKRKKKLPIWEYWSWQMNRQKL